MALRKRLAICASVFCVYASAASAQGTPPTQAAPPVRYPILRPNGRFSFDAAAYQTDRKHLSSGTEVRRARLAVAGNFTPDWSFQLELEYADDLARVSDAWVQYAFNSSMRTQMGHFKEFFDMEGATSSRF